MKHNILLAFLFVLALTCSCTGQKPTGNDNGTSAAEGTMTYTFKDSCKHLVVSLSLELPLGEDSATMLIRDSLIEDFVFNAQQPGYDMEGTHYVKRFAGDYSDPQAIVDYYGKADYDFLLRQAKADYDDRMQYLESDTTMTAEDRERIKNDVPMWEYDFSVKALSDTLGIVVYQSQMYVYYGGAHGGVAGSGALTFSKATGEKIRCFIADRHTSAMQPMIRRGLLQYYRLAGETLSNAELDDRLQIDSKQIPLPVDAAYPNATADSLIFTYRQYEIACYADGMPSFTLPVKQLLPYLTPQAKALLLP